MADELAVGERLRQERERRSLSLEQVHECTGIGVRILRSLEEGGAGVIEGVYMRLALTSYAEYLNLPAAEFVARYDAAFGAPAPGPPVRTGLAPPLPPPPPSIRPSWPDELGDRLRHASSGWLIGFIAVVLLAVVLLLVYLRDNETAASTAAPPLRPGPAAGVETGAPTPPPLARSPETRAAEARPPAAAPPGMATGASSGPAPADLAPRPAVAATRGPESSPPALPEPPPQSAAALAGPASATGPVGTAGPVADATAAAVAVAPATPDGGSPRGGLTALADGPPELPGPAPVPADAAPGGEPAAAPADAGQVAPTEIPVRGDLAALEAPQAIVLEGLALDSTWIQIQWDGRGTSEEIVPQGQRRRWVARDSLLIRSGRARGIRFYYQG
ncbi:MAG: helix-turn-helix domain-containing protein, partial [Gemmatimonadota bacterium]